MILRRASPDDVTELLCDTTGTSMQVGAVLVLDAPLALVDVRAALSDRVGAVPQLRQRLLSTPFGCGRPVWSDDPHFDITRHVHGLPWPAGGAQNLLDAVAHVITQRLPADRPLWSATLVGPMGGRQALVVVFHHVLSDGIGGIAVLTRLVDGERIAADTNFPRPGPRSAELFGDALRARLHAVARLSGLPARLRAAAAELGGGRPRRAPRCSLNRPIGTQRALRVVEIDLDTVRAAAHANGGTINDAVVAAAAGALGAVLARRGERTDTLVFSLPVSARRNATVADLGNQVGVMPVQVPTGGDPEARLAAVAAIIRSRKTSHPGASAALFGPAFRVLARLGLFGWFINRQQLVNSFITNLPGPTDALTFLGVRVVEVIPVPMISGNVSVAIGALSYAGRLAVTVVADPEQCPDVAEVADALHREFAALALGIRSAPHGAQIGTFGPAASHASSKP